MERNKRLLGRQAISVQEYEISVANYQKAKSTYELSGNNMRDTRLTAPFEGSIEKRLVENYQRVNAGEGVVQLVNTQKLRIKFTVPDDYLYLLRAKKTYVWVVEGNKVSRREVTVYSPTGEANLLISKGLEPGETVVTAGVYQLTEGEAIKVLM